jgi:toxin secretion/phage lysis holin
VLLIFDFITGIEAALKTGQPVESKKVLRTAVKMTMYFLLISAGYMAEKAVPLISFIDDTIISFLAVTELISILENTSRSGYAIPVKLVEKLKAFKQNT